MAKHGTALLALCWIPLLACGAPRSIKNASQTQIEALEEAQAGVQGYLDLTEQILDKADAARNFAKEAEAVAQAVEDVLADEVADPIDASDRVANKLFSLRRLAREERQADQFRKRHEEALTQLISLLKLLEQNQRLIHEYVTADVGPTEEQIARLAAELRKLQTAGGEGP